MKKLLFVLLLAAVWGGQVSAQTSQESLKEYVPVLPSVKAKFWKIDPTLGYAVKSFGGRNCCHVRGRQDGGTGQ